MAVDLTQSYYNVAQTAYAKNLEKLQYGKDVLNKLITSYEASKYYGAGGAGETYQKMLEEQKRLDVSAGVSSLYGQGLAGTTLRGRLPMAWESQVGAPARAKLEDVRRGTEEKYKMDLMNLITGVETPYPDYGALMQAQAAQASVPTETGARGKTEYMRSPPVEPATGGYAQPTVQAKTATEQQTYTPYWGTYGTKEAYQQAQQTQPATTGQLRPVITYDTKTGKKITNWYQGSQLVAKESS